MTKYKVYVLFLFIITLCSFNFIKAEDNNKVLLDKIIYIDPGHGGADPGAIYKDIYEANINLEISKKLAYTLEQNGAIVMLTRSDTNDLSKGKYIKKRDLNRRINMINSSNADIYLSIHLNADISTTWRGAQVFYDDVNPENKKLAEIMQKTLKKILKTNREYKEIKTIYLSRNIKKVGVLIEVGFLTNPNERYLLLQDTYQQKVCNAITQGIINYFKETIT